MEPTKPRAAGRTALSLIVACLIGAVLAPVAVYLFGSTVMGPYEGDGGLVGFASGVFGAAADGRFGALALLLTPAGLVLTWWLVFLLVKRPREQREAKADKS